MYMYMQVSNKKELNQSEEEILWEKGLFGEDIERKDVGGDGIGEGVELCIGNDNEDVGETIMEMGLFMGDDDGDGSVYGR